MPDHRIFDVVIVGSGLAGASLALALTRLVQSDRLFDLQIAIVEAKPLSHLTSVSQDARRLVLSYGSSLIFQALQIWPDIEQKTCPLRHIHVSEQGSFGAVRFDAKTQQVPALGYVLPLTSLQTELVRQLKTHPSITWFSPDKVEQIGKDNTLRTLQLKKTGEIKTRLVVAADGAQSVIRQLLQIKSQTKDYPEQALLSELTASSLSHTAYERFSKKGTIALLPTGQKGRASIVRTGTPAQIAAWQALDEASFLSELQKAFGYRAGKLSALGQRRVYPLQLVRAEASVCDGVVLIGHAAHTIHPIAAQGFNLSLRDVAMLAEIIEQALRENCQLNDPNVLSEYANARTQDQAKIIQSTDLLARVFRHNTLPLRLMRNMGLLSCDLLAPLKNKLACHAMGLAGKLPRLACR